MIGAPGDSTPFILHEEKLYLARYYRLEEEVARLTLSLNQSLPDIDHAALHQILDTHIGIDPTNRQRLAALLAISRRLTIITGGPGTGKTSTVARILDILLTQNPDLQVKLAAPTGKAAMRLSESLSAQPVSADHAHEVITLHRLLGMHSSGRTFRRGPLNPINADLVIVDEASMIDLSLMRRLLLALPRDARLLLLGDPHQLPSVDTGNVLADLCSEDPDFTFEFRATMSELVDFPESSGRGNKLHDAVCHLDKSYRFDQDSGIGRLAAETKTGTATFMPSGDGSVTISPPVTQESCGKTLLSFWDEYLELLTQECTDPERLMESFSRARVLCSHRTGFPGVELVNRAIETELEARGLKQTGENFYVGRPVLVTRNDYPLNLYNGDIGICVRNERGEFEAGFPAGDGANQRIYPVSRLPVFETCFAMTVHKSQGSEFDHVSLLLIEEGNADDELTSRELVYTAITRAKTSIQIHGTADAWSKAITTSAQRASGMTGFLQSAD